MSIHAKDSLDFILTYPSSLGEGYTSTRAEELSFLDRVSL